MNILFIRHSKSLINPDIPINTWGLSEEGVDLAKKLSNLNELKELDIIYASLQPKALETAILATKNIGIPIKIDDRLTETTSFTNKFVNLEQLEKNTKEYYSNENTSINNGETVNEALARFNTAINDIVTAEKDEKNLGIVTHGNILASFVVQYTKGDAFELVEKIRQPDVSVFNWETKQFTSFFGDIII